MSTRWIHLIAVGILLNFSCALAAPIDNWHWRNPLPNGNPQIGRQTLNGIVFASGKFVAVGNSGFVSISLDSTNWSQNPTAATNNLNGLVYGGGQFVAVGDGGVVETSADGTNWVVHSSGTTGSLASVSYGNGKFVAVGSSAAIASPDGVHWTQSTSGMSGALQVAGGNIGFVAVAKSAQAYFSTDGLTWTAETFNPPLSTPYLFQNDAVTYWKGVYIIASVEYSTYPYVYVYSFTSTDGTHWGTNYIGQEVNISQQVFETFLAGCGNWLIAGGAYVSGAVNYVQFSQDGTNWSQTNNIPISSSYPYNSYARAGAFGNGTYALLGDATYTSTDGINWTSRGYVPPPPPGPTYTFTCIASNNGVYVVASGNSFAISSNGLSYVIASNTPALSSVLAVSNEFVGVGSGGAIYVSSNGLSWTQHTSGTTSSLHGVAAGSGLLVAVGDGGAIQTSPTGLIWTSRASGTSLALYSLIYSNGIFVAVGQQGTVLTSPDGINWTGQYSGVLSNLLSVAYGSAGFLAVGTGGTVVTSPDGANWTTQYPGTSTTLESVSFGNGYYLATADNGVALSSPDGVTWTSRNLGVTGGQNLYGSAFINSRFEVVGANGTILESDVIAPLFDVQFHRASPQNGFTMFAPAGSNFRLQVCTNLLSGWSDVTSFNNVSAITQWTNSSAGYKQQFYRLVSP